MRFSGCPEVRKVNSLRLIAWSVRSGLSRRSTAAVGVLLSSTFLAVICVLVARVASEQAAVLEQGADRVNRQIVLRPEGGRLIPPETVDIFAAFGSIEWVVGFGRAVDLRSEQTGRDVVARPIYWATDKRYDPRCLLRIPLGVASTASLNALGHASPVGSLVNDDGVELSLVERVQPSPPGLELGTTVELICGDTMDGLAVVVISVQDLGSLGPHTELAREIAAASEDTNIATVESSEAVLEFFRESVGEIERSYTALITGATMTMTVVSLIWNTTQTASRRQDFGRRRALGSTRLVLQVSAIIESVTLASIAVLLGSVMVLGLQVVLSPWDSLSFWLPAIALLYVSTFLGTVVPVAAAALRSPVNVLRST